eukprot:scaffold1140_cov251-Pinguiococcus_pyrenoidosus.AAC.9
MDTYTIDVACSFDSVDYPVPISGTVSCTNATTGTLSQDGLSFFSYDEYSYSYYGGEPLPDLFYLFHAPREGQYTVSLASSKIRIDVYLLRGEEGDHIDRWNRLGGDSVAYCEGHGDDAQCFTTATFELVPGGYSYIIALQVDADSASSEFGSSNFSVSVRCPVPIDITLGPTLTCSGGAQSGIVGDPAFGGPDGVSYWRFTPDATTPEDGTGYLFGLCDESFPSMALYALNETSPGNFERGLPIETFVGFGSTLSCGPASVVAVPEGLIDTSKEYVLGIEQALSGDGDYTVDVACPGDEYPHQVPIESDMACGSVVNGSTAQALDFHWPLVISGTFNEDYYDYYEGPTHPDVIFDFDFTDPDRYYRFSLSSSAEVFINTCEAQFDTVLYLFNAEGESVDVLGDIVAVNDDGCYGNLGSFIRATVPAGDYIILVEGYYSSRGPFELSLACEGGGGTGTPTPAPVSAFSPSAAPTEYISLSGVMSCSSETSGTIFESGRGIYGNADLPDLLYLFEVPLQGRYTLTLRSTKVPMDITMLRQSAGQDIDLWTALESVSVVFCEGSGDDTRCFTTVIFELAPEDTPFVVVLKVDGDRPASNYVSSDFSVLILCPVPVDITVGPALTCSGDAQSGTLGDPAFGGPSNVSYWPFVPDAVAAANRTGYLFGLCNEFFPSMALYELNGTASGGFERGPLIQTFVGFGSTLSCGPASVVAVPQDLIDTSKEYVLEIEQALSGDGDYTVAVACPGDEYPHQVPIESNMACGSMVNGSTAQALDFHWPLVLNRTDEEGEGDGDYYDSYDYYEGPTHPDAIFDFESTDPDRYYRFSLSSSAEVFINTCEAQFDTVLYLFNAEGESVDVLGDIVAVNDDGCPQNLGSFIRATVPAGNYIILVEGYGYSRGPFELSLACETEDVDVPSAAPSAPDLFTSPPTVRETLAPVDGASAAPSTRPSAPPTTGPSEASAPTPTPQLPEQIVSGRVEMDFGNAVSSSVRLSEMFQGGLDDALCQAASLRHLSGCVGDITSSLGDVSSGRSSSGRFRRLQAMTYSFEVRYFERDRLDRSTSVLNAVLAGFEDLRGSGADETQFYQSIETSVAQELARDGGTVDGFDSDDIAPALAVAQATTEVVDISEQELGNEPDEPSSSSSGGGGGLSTAAIAGVAVAIAFAGVIVGVLGYWFYGRKSGTYESYGDSSSSSRSPASSPQNSSSSQRSRWGREERKQERKEEWQVEIATVHNTLSSVTEE